MVLPDTAHTDTRLSLNRTQLQQADRLPPWACGEPRGQPRGADLARSQREPHAESATIDFTVVSEHTNVGERTISLTFKRALDLVAGSIAGAVALIPCLVIAVLIKLDSPGPVLQREWRAGRFGRTFAVYRFRTTREDARPWLKEPSYQGELQAAPSSLRDVPHVTRMGSLLHKTGLVEVPQLLNIIRGDLSLFRPRVPRSHGLEGRTPRQRRQPAAKSGMTGLWSVSGRSTLTFDQRPLFIAARYKYLLILPFALILSTTLVMSVMSRSTRYESVSRVLVQSARFEQTDPNSGCNPYISLAQCIAGSMNMLLSTDQFAAEVAAEAGLPVTTEADRATSVQVVRSGTSVAAAGDGLVVIWHTSDNPAEAQRLTAALVATYDKRYIEIVRRDGESATRFYEVQLENDKRAQFEATTAFARWRESAPASAMAGTDPEYTRLQGEVQLANRRVQETADRLDEIEQFVASVEQNRQDAFDIVDPANVGVPVTTGLRKLMVFPVAGLLLALSISAALFAFLMKTDRSVRVADDLRAIPGLAVLGTMPDMSHEKRPDWPKDFFRLAITTFGTPERPVRERE